MMEVEKQIIPNIREIFNKEEYEECLKVINNHMKSNKTLENSLNLIVIKAQALAEMDRLPEAIQVLKNCTDDRVGDLRTKYENHLKLESSINPKLPECSKYIKFEEWIKTNEGKFSKLKIILYAPDYRGVHAISTIKQNDPFLKIPEKLIITSKKGQMCPLGKKIKESGVKLSYDYLTFLSVFLLEAANDPKSWWAPYIKMIPTNVSNFPLFYTKEEINMFEGSIMEEYIKSTQSEFDEEYNLICKHVPEMKKYSLESYMKIKTLVISRIFFVKIDNVDERIIVPYADMFNHHYEKIGQSFWKYDSQSKEFVVTAQKQIPRGESICENYGQKPNFRFLFYYGFVIEENILNAVYIDIFLEEKDPLLEIKRKMIGVSNLKIQRCTFFNDFSQNDNNLFFSLMRFICYKGEPTFLLEHLDPQPVDIINIKSTKRKVNLEHYSIENEILMHQKIILIVEQNLSKYKTTIEEDLQILKTNLNFNQRNTRVLLKCDKQLYEMMREMSHKSIELLNLNYDKACKEFEKLKTKDFKSYIEKAVLGLLKDKKISVPPAN